MSCIFMSCNFMSCIFIPCDLVRHLHVLQFHVRHFQSTRTKFDSGWSSAPNPAGGAYSAPTGPYLDLRDPTSKGRKWRGREGKAQRKEGGDVGISMEGSRGKEG